jgi:phosphoribosylanthranilate isomerase
MCLGRPVRSDIKFCGLTREEDAEYAADLGATYLGVIFAGGPRMLTVKRAMEVFAPVGMRRLRVGVFGDQSADEIARAADWLQLSVVQLHGDTTPERIAAIRRDYDGLIWTVCRVAGAGLPSHVESLIDAGDGILVDAFSPGQLGGTGITLPWGEMKSDFASLRARHKTVILAGGLRPENVAQAMAALSPNVVDVSSGVESAPGIKDHDRMRAFRDAVEASRDT